VAFPRRLAFALAMASLGCQPTTTRPVFLPYPQAAATEIRLGTSEATRRLAEALRQDSIPIAKVEQRDGYLDSGWFEGATGKSVHRRPLGPGIVRVRAWAEPARAYSSTLIVETVYRPLADPSRADRELERPVPDDHAVAVKVRATLEAMVKKFGGPPAGATPAVPPAKGLPAPATPRTP
jgi:hypothetical protein